MRKSPTSCSRPESNRLLDALPVGYGKRLKALCDTVTITFGEVLTESDAPISHVYFPIRGFISLIAPADATSTLEVGLIGSEGMLGATLSLQVAQSPLQAIVQGDGSALRLPAARFRTALKESAELHALMAKYCYVILRQCAQAAACGHYHAVPARLARWLLMTQDRAHGPELQLTQDFLSRMLGVRRVGVTQAASQLKADHLITYHRGSIVVHDRKGLEAIACACYRTDRRIYQRVLG